MSQIIKPEPLVMGGKAFYTLSSYDPVEIEVDVPQILDAEIELAVANMVENAGGSTADLADDAWVAEHFEGVKNADELRANLRANLQFLNMRVVEEQKMHLAVEKLAERLGQSVPEAQLESMRARLRFSFAQDAAQAGMSEEEYLARIGLTREAFEASLEKQARAAAEQEAALSAYASEKKLKVADEEVGASLGLSPERTEQIIDEAKEAGQFEYLRDAALISKAAGAVVAECSCTYKHETPAEAERRFAAIKAMVAAEKAADAKKEGPDLKLV